MKLLKYCHVDINAVITRTGVVHVICPLGVLFLLATRNPKCVICTLHSTIMIHRESSGPRVYPVNIKASCGFSVL